MTRERWWFATGSRRLRCAAPDAAELMLDLMLQLLGIAAVVALCIGAIDYLWQRAEHLRRNRMSQKELRDEHKEAEGDPMFKQQRRARAHLRGAVDAALVECPVEVVRLERV